MTFPNSTPPKPDASSPGQADPLHPQSGSSFYQPANPNQAPSLGGQPTPLTGGKNFNPLSTYQTMQQYYGPLSTQPTPTVQNLNNPAFQAVADQLSALQVSHPILNGAVTPDPNSKSVKQSMNAGQIAGAVAKATVQQMVTDPVNQFINTWKTNPMEGLKETLIGGAIIGAGVGIDVLTGGAATPFLVAAGAALVAPGLVKSWADEVQHPSDANLVHALTNTATGVLTVGVPVKGFNGLVAVRRGAEAGIVASKELTTVDDAEHLLLSGRPEMRGLIKFNVPIENQLEVLASTPQRLATQLNRLGISVEDNPDIKDLVDKTNESSLLQRALDLAKQGGDSREIGAAQKNFDDHLKNGFIPARLRSSYNWLFMPQNPYDHVLGGISEEEMASIPNDLSKTVDASSAAMNGAIRRLGLGHGFDGIGGEIKNARSAIEHFAFDKAGGGAAYSMTKLQSGFRDMIKAANIDTAGVEKIWQGLEDKGVWDTLSASEKYVATKMREVLNSMTVAEMRRGTIRNPVPGIVNRYFRPVSQEGGPTSKSIQDVLAWVKNPMMSPSRIWMAAGDIANDESPFISETRQEILDRETKAAVGYEQSRVDRNIYNEFKDEIRSSRQAIGGLKSKVTEAEAKLAKLDQKDPEFQNWASKLDDRKQKLEDAINNIKRQYGPDVHRMIETPKAKMESLISKSPLQKELIQGIDSLNVHLAGFVNRMHEASVRDELMSISNLNVESLKSQLGGALEQFWGLELLHPELKNKDLIHILPEDVFHGGMGDPDTVAANAGFVRIPIRSVGRPGDVNYKPALFANAKIASDIIKAMEDSVSGSEMNDGIMGAIYKVGSVSKRSIMMTPPLHFLNVAGRTIGWLLNDPVFATSALKDIWGSIGHDPAAYADLQEEFSMAGGRHADMFNVSKHLALQQKEADGQYSWPGVLRAGEKLLDQHYHDGMERAFWKGVDDVQLAAYAYAKNVLRRQLPDSSEAEIRRAAALYGSNLGGTVNPLYVSKLYQQMKNLMFFAPSYWGTFMRSVASAIPGSAKISEFLAKFQGGRFVRYGAAPFKEIDPSIRKELVRMNRSWFFTYMATALASADLFNVMLGGNHIWDNEPGRMTDIKVDNAVKLFGGQPVDASGKSSYVSGFPVFSQAATVANAIGLGHEWGFAHQFSDPTWQAMDGFHKAQMLAGALFEGSKREAVNKVSTPIQAGYGLAMGEQFGPRFGQGVQSKFNGPLGNWESLLSLVPAGQEAQYYAETFNPNQDPKKAQQARSTAIGGIRSSILNQITGIPSVYHLGAEKSGIDSDKITQWNNTRNSLHEAMTTASQKVLSGQMQITDYLKAKTSVQTKLIQNDKDTFGNSSPSGSLSSMRVGLMNQYGLDNPSLSTDEWMNQYELFNAAWDQQLQSTSPSAKAAWWETETAQWTDVDYLQWEATQLKDALAASIDGQGGNYIRAFQNKISPLNNLPLTSAERTDLESQDPYYYTYKQTLKSMSQSSALGALVNAFSPYGTLTIAPQGSTPDQVQALADSTIGTVLSSQTAQSLAAQAKQIAHEPQVGQAAGNAAPSPEFQQSATQAINDAQAGSGGLGI
jgi:hypothetical protein